MIYSDVYDKGMLRKCLFLLAGTALLLMLTKGVFVAFFPLIAIMAMMSRRSEWLLFTVLLFITATVGNNYFMKKGTLFGICERLSLFMIAAVTMTKLAGRPKSRYVTPFMGMLVYIAWMCLSSADGWSPIVSYLKILLFVAIYMSFFAVSDLVILDSHADDRALRSVVLSIACFFVIGSFCLIPFPNIGVMSMGDLNPSELVGRGDALSLFKGMTSHSQSLGPIIAATSTLLFADLCFTVKKWDPLYVIMLVMSPILIYKTSSRTALGAYVAGMGAVAWLVLHSRGIGKKWKGKIVSALFTVVIICSVSVMAISSVRVGVLSFLLKFGTATSTEQITMEELTSSRQGLMDEAMDSFKKKPLHGNGFQVSSEMQYEKRAGIMSYLSAPIEKGVWVTAVLEEGGAVGFGIIVIFMLSTIFTLYKIKSYIAMSTFLVLIVSNLGEFTMFSMSYTGGYIWSLVFAGAAMDAQRAKSNRLANVGWNFHGW